MRILVIGGSGLVGSHLLAEGRARGHATLGTYRNFPLPDLVKVDLGNETGTLDVLKSFQPDCVVHAAGWTWVDGCEQDKQRAFEENCEQPVRLAMLSKQIGARFVYFSTTYIFDGARQEPYSETDTPNPINVYARSKWDAEKRIQDILAGEALIPRVICVWGREAQQKNFVYQALKALRERKRLRLPSDQAGNPTWAGDIAWWLLSLLENGKNGVWNLAGDAGAALRVEWFRQIWMAAKDSGMDCEDFANACEAIPTSRLGQAAPRPLNAVACTTKLRGYLPARLPAGPGEISKLTY